MTLSKVLKLVAAAFARSLSPKAHTHPTFKVKGKKGLGF